MKNYLLFCNILLLSFFSFLSCDNLTGKDDDSVSYPYTEHEIRYLGIKSGLTSSSPEAAFSAGLTEVMQAYAASHPSSSDDLNIDGITYDLTNVQSIAGGVPNSVWDTFWEDINTYSYSVGSCWGFAHYQIPNKGGTGTVYVLYTIVTNSYSHEVLYRAGKGNLSPK